MFSKKEIDKNKESTDKAEDRDEPICSFEEGVIDFLKGQCEIDTEIFTKFNMARDAIIKQAEFIQIAYKAIVELQDKNKILEKEVALLRKELDQLKAQGK